MYRPISARLSSTLISNLNGLFKDLRGGCRKSLQLQQAPELVTRPAIIVEQVTELHQLRFHDNAYLQPRQLQLEHEHEWDSPGSPHSPHSPQSPQSPQFPSVPAAALVVVEEMPVDMLPCQLCSQSTDAEITLDSQKYFTTLCDGCAVRDLQENLEFAGVWNSPLLQFL